MDRVEKEAVLQCVRSRKRVGPHIRRQRMSRVADVLNRAGENEDREEEGRRRPRQSDAWVTPSKVRVAQVCGYGYRVGQKGWAMG